MAISEIQRVADLEVASSSVDKKASGATHKRTAFATIKISAKRVFIAYYMYFARVEYQKRA